MSCKLTWNNKIFTLEEFKTYVESHPEEFKEWLNPVGEVQSGDYEFRITQSLLSDEGRNLFKRFFKDNKEKFYAELNKSVKKPQIELLKTLVENKEYDNVADLATDFALNFGFTVEVNTAMHDRNIHMGVYSDQGDQDFIGSDGSRYEFREVINHEGDIETQKWYKDNKEISADEYFKALETAKLIPTQHYYNLTVPGGINYTENEIKTPNITPSIKGHAAFATKHGVGWFRSDDKAKEGTYQEQSEFNEIRDETGGQVFLDKNIIRVGESTKTRRILEVQSDLFQKGREKSNLVQSKYKEGLNELEEAFATPESGLIAQPKENQFLQLLNKDNNWVTFFIKAIIQDSAKKGYEKVLFPSGNTAAKVEGHQTLEDFIKDKEKRIRERTADLERSVYEERYNDEANHQQALINKISSENEHPKKITDAPQDFYINQKITGTNKNFSRIRRNMHGVMPMDLVNDSNYTGWVLQNYTVGEDNPIYKISDEQAQKYLNKDYEIRKKSLEDDLKQAKENLEKFKGNKEKWIDERIRNAKAEIVQLEKEVKDAKEGRLKINAISDFYQSTIQNILKKRGYNPIETTDEYGNKWFEVNLDNQGRVITFDSPISVEQAEKDIKALYKPITLFTLPDGSPVLAPKDIPGMGSKIAQKVMQKYGWTTLRGLISFDRKSPASGRSAYIILKIDREELKRRLGGEQIQMFDTGLSGLAEAMETAALSQSKLEKHLDRITQEAQKIQKVINKIDSETIRTRLRDAVSYVQDPEKMKDTKNFAYMIFEAAETLKYYADRLKKVPELSVRDRIAEIDRVKTVADNFKDLINFLNKEFRYVDNSNEFKVQLNELSNRYDQIQTIYAAEAVELAVEVLSEHLSPDKKIALEILQKDLENLNEQRIKAVNASASEKFIKGIDIKIKNTKKKVIELVPDKDMIDETIRGLRGDLDWITANLRSSLAMGDPIISGFFRKLKAGYDKIRHKLMPLRDAAYSQLEKYKSTLRLSNNLSMSKFYKGLYEIQEVHHLDLDGEIQKNSYYTLLSPFKESFYNEKLAYEQKIKALRKLGEDPNALEKVEKEYRDFLKKYAERKYKNEWYDRYDLLISEAAEARQHILDEMNNILRAPNRDALTEDEIERLHELKYDLKRLGSLRNEDGQLKTGLPLKIAESIQKFNKETTRMSHWEITEENRNWFNIIQGKKKEQLTQGLISQEDYDRWYHLNTQRLIKPEFYKDRKTITDNISSLMAKLPKEQFKDDVSKLWEEIVDVSRPYRDDDNIIDGSDVTQVESEKVKEDEDKIEDLKRKLIRFSGLNLTEEQELAALWHSIESLSPAEIRRFTELRDKKAAYKKIIGNYLNDAEIKLLMDSFARLSEMQKWIPTEYYIKIYNEKLDAFRMKIDPNFEENLEDVREAFESRDEWYKANHVLHDKKVVDDGEVYYTEVMEPLYIWKDIIPTDPKYIEENAPGFAFRTRIVKDEFLNPDHKLDIKERILPKKYIVENGKVAISPYYNREYDNLEQLSLDDEQAKAKWEMLQFLTKTHLEAQGKLPTYKRLGYVLPGLMKHGYDRTLDRGVKGTFDAARNLFIRNQEQKDLVLGDISQMDLSIIPVKYSTGVETNDQNLNLMEAVLKHYAATEEYELLESELGEAKVISQALKTAKDDVSTSTIERVLKNTGFSKFIPADKQSRRSRAFDEFIRTMFYGETQHAFPQIIPGIDTNKIVSNFLGLSSIQLMVLNIPAHITNIISGEIQNIIEANAKKYFTYKDYRRAKVIWAANVHNFWQDYGKEGKHSFWTALMEHFDVPSGDFMEDFGHKTAFSRARFLKSHLMIIKHTGEHEIQGSVLIAMMEKFKVSVHGETTPLYKALEYTDGKIKIKDGSTKLDGTLLTEEDLTNFQNRVHSILRALNGAYSKFDRTIAEKSLLGKLAFYMRKYFIPMAFRRFETFKYDFEEQEFKEGYYLTGAKLIKDVWNLNIDIVKNWSTYKETFTAEEARNLRRLFSETLVLVMLALTISLIGGYDDDRKLKGRWGYTMALYQLMKAKSEAETLLPLPYAGINELTSIYRSPFASASTVGTLGKTLSDTWHWAFQSDDAYFKSPYGIWKEGDLRLKADILKLSGINVNIITPENIIKNFELRQR